MTKKTSKRIATRARKLLKLKQQTSDSYKKMDRLLKEIREIGMKPGDKVAINAAGDKVVLKDIHAETDKVFRTHCCSRYEIELEKSA